MGRNAKNLPGSPQHVMTQIARRLLRRLRAQCPFPYDREKVLLSLLPDGIATKQDWKCANARISMNWDKRVQVALPTEDTSFWMTFDKVMPAPRPVGNLFDMSPESEFYDGTCDWYDRARGVEDTLTECMEAIIPFVDWVENWQSVKQAWPELATFLQYDIPRSHSTTRIAKSKLAYNIPTAKRDRIIETLAAATLLSDAPCHAWIEWTEDGE